jgi:hypothetical protein
MDKLAKGLVVWNGENGNRLDRWNPMRGSLRFLDFGDFRSFTSAIVTVYPYCDNGPVLFIEGMIFIVDKLRAVGRSDGVEANSKVNNTLKTWIRDRKDESLVSLIKCSADAVLVREFSLYSDFIASNIASIKNLYFMREMMASLALESY